MNGDEGKSQGGMAASAAASGDPRHLYPYHPQYQQQQQQLYGTFQGVPNYSHQPAIGFPQPAPPPGVHGSPSPPLSHPPYHAPAYYAHGYQTVPAYAAVAEGMPLIMPRLPCCGMGSGWFLFFIGFFFAAVPWYIGAFILLCVRIDYREKPGFIACMIAAVLTAFAVLFGVSKGADDW